MSRRREQARQLLKHYFTVALTKDAEDINVDNDVNAELDDLADLLIEAAVEEAVIQIESTFHLKRRKHARGEEKIKAAEERADV